MIQLFLNPNWILYRYLNNNAFSIQIVTAKHIHMMNQLLSPAWVLESTLRKKWRKEISKNGKKRKIKNQCSSQYISNCKKWLNFHYTFLFICQDKNTFLNMFDNQMKINSIIYELEFYYIYLLLSLFHLFLFSIFHSVLLLYNKIYTL